MSDGAGKASVVCVDNVEWTCVSSREEIPVYVVVSRGFFGEEDKMAEVEVVVSGRGVLHCCVELLFEVVLCKGCGQVVKGV